MNGAKASSALRAFASSHFAAVGVQLLERVLRVDHAGKYRKPKKKKEYDAEGNEIEKDSDDDEVRALAVCPAVRASLVVAVRASLVVLLLLCACSVRGPPAAHLGLRNVQSLRRRAEAVAR